eukprot:gene13302-biopygen6505
MCFRGNVAVPINPCTNTGFSRTSPFSDRRHRGRGGGSGSECWCGGYTVPGLKEQVRGKLSGWAEKGFYNLELGLGIYRAFSLGGVEWVYRGFPYVIDRIGHHARSPQEDASQNGIHLGNRQAPQHRVPFGWVPLAQSFLSYKPGPSCLDLALYPRSAYSLGAKNNHRVTGRRGLLQTQEKRKGTAHSDNWLRATARHHGGHVKGTALQLGCSIQVKSLLEG